MALIDERFERAFEEMRAMREEMHAGFLGVRGEIAAIRSDARRCAAISQRCTAIFAALQRQITHIVAGFAIALLGVVATGIAAAVTDAF